jgi:hydrogenase maturation protein HypF
MSELCFPVVATSGNLSDEPICTDEREALSRLEGIADFFLVHNRPIARHVDDSVVRVMAGREMVMRRARGYAPLPVRLETPAPTVLAVGAHLKNSIALSVGQNAFTSQHIGDLETVQSLEAFRRVIGDFERLYEAVPSSVACDAHPEYLSTRFALGRGLPVVSVQHHAAHVYSCMAENELRGPVLGVSWDGTGYGADGTVWGGEFLRVGEIGAGFTRAAHLRTFRLPGGDRAVREPRRTAAGLLYELLGEGAESGRHLMHPESCSAEELSMWLSMLRKGINAPVTSSMGRLFDAVASLVGLRQRVRFEGQAALELEYALAGIDRSDGYPFRVKEPRDAGGALVVDWALLIYGVLLDLNMRVPVPVISARFHNTLVEMIVEVARRIGEERVALTGGCFQNKYLTERAISRLREEGFKPYWHQSVPPNDGGIALGQIAAASAASSAQRREG